MLARAPKLGKRWRICSAERSTLTVTAPSSRRIKSPKLCGERDVHLDSLTGNADVDVSPAEDTGTARALAGVPLPAVMTAYRIGFRFMWEETLAAARAAEYPPNPS